MLTDTSSKIAVETNGVNPVVDAERRGTPKGLFVVWFSWNVSILGIGYGIFIVGLGLNAWQAILAGLIGYAVSTMLVGVLAVGGPRTGLPTLTHTRFSFGVQGNKFPTFWVYISNLGWKVTLLALAATSGASLLTRLWPTSFPNNAHNHKGNVQAIVLWFVIALVVTMIVAVVGHRLILRLENWIAWITGLMTVIFIILIIPKIDWGKLGNAQVGSFSSFIGGVVLAMTIVGLGYLNNGGDFARYLPRTTPARSVIGWTVVGITVPVTVLLVLGAVIATTDPGLARVASNDPIGALTSLLPLWFLIPFTIVIVLSMIAAAVNGLYSSGLTLLALGVPYSRAACTVMNMVAITAGASYLLFVSDSFLATFQAFLAIISVVMGSMAAIQITDFPRQRRLGWNTDLARPNGEGGRAGRWTALVSLGVSCFVGLGTVTSSDPYIAKITGFLLSDSAAKSTIGTSNIGVLIAMVAAAGLYSMFTYVLGIELPGRPAPVAAAAQPDPTHLASATESVEGA